MAMDQPSFVQQSPDIHWLCPGQPRMWSHVNPGMSCSPRGHDVIWTSAGSAK